MNNKTGSVLRFPVLTAAGVKMIVFWDVAPCNLISLIALMMEAVSASRTSVTSQKTAIFLVSNVLNQTVDETCRYMLAASYTVLQLRIWDVLSCS
jgi:hypothetical protein